MSLGALWILWICVMKFCISTCWMCSIVMLLAMSGCSSAPKAQTTFLQSVDLIDMTDRMAESFAHNAAMTSRGQSDQPWIISINRVTNHTNQIIPDREKWLYIARLRAQLAQSNLARERSLVWIIPPERWPIVAEELGVSREPYGLRMNPTHQLTAEFYALTNTSGQGRSDAYFCDYQLVDLASGTLVWEDKWEVKRAIVGRTYD
jgi:hypothetical protein